MLTEDESEIVKGLGLLTLKPLIYAANVSEDDLGNHGANNVHVQVGAATACRFAGFCTANAFWSTCSLFGCLPVAEAVAHSRQALHSLPTAC